jgi:tetratricopeptide (TPR) repeat protein
MTFAMLQSQEQFDRDDAQKFLRTVTPFVAAGDFERARDSIGRCWCGEKLCRFLKHTDAPVRIAAALSLTLLGDKKAIEPLTAALHDPDAQVHQAAEEALWAIWFRCGLNRSICHLKCGTHHLKHGNLDTAAEKFSLAIEADPGFAEAYNQRAIAYYLGEGYTQSIADCQQALKLMPPHFGAMAGMGHCHAHLGHYAEARQCYRQALEINPRMEGIAASLIQIQEILALRQ